MVNQRSLARLAARIHERAAHCLEFEINDPRATFITITRVELSSDLSAGKIHYSVLGGPGEKSKAAHMLESAGGYIQRQVGRVLELRRMPRLAWVYDDSIERQAKLEGTIQQALERDREIQERGHSERELDEGGWEKEYDDFVGKDDEGAPAPKPKPKN